MKTEAYGQDWSCLEGTNALVSHGWVSEFLGVVLLNPGTKGYIFLWVAHCVVLELSFPQTLRYICTLISSAISLPTSQTLHVHTLSWEIRKFLLIYVYIFLCNFPYPFPILFLSGGFKIKLKDELIVKGYLYFTTSKYEHFFPFFVFSICMFIQKLWESTPQDWHSAWYLWN